MRQTIWKYRVSFLVLFCLAVLCWSLSRGAYQELKKQPPSTTFQNVGDLLAADYEPMLRFEAQAKTPLPFTLWAQTNNQRLEGLGTGRVQDVSWIAAKGYTRLLFPVMTTLNEEDTDGCLIDRVTAEKLFRNINAIGSTVKIGGKEYIVRSVLDGPSRTIITQLASDSRHVLFNITVSGSENTEMFLLRHNLTADITIKNSLYVSIARIFYLIPVLGVILVCLRFLVLLRTNWKHYTVRYLLVSIGMIAVGTAGILLFFTIIPKPLIPSQWSDFEFWRPAINSFLQSVSGFISSPKYRPDLPQLYVVFQSAVSILSVCFIISLYNLFRLHFCRQQSIISPSQEVRYANEIRIRCE